MVPGVMAVGVRGHRRAVARAQRAGVGRLHAAQSVVGRAGFHKQLLTQGPVSAASKMVPGVMAVGVRGHRRAVAQAR